jgi:hypothetical protein
VGVIGSRDHPAQIAPGGARHKGDVRRIFGITEYLQSHYSRCDCAAIDPVITTRTFGSERAGKVLDLACVITGAAMGGRTSTIRLILRAPRSYVSCTFRSQRAKAVVWSCRRQNQKLRQIAVIGRRQPGLTTHLSLGVNALTVVAASVQRHPAGLVRISAVLEHRHLHWVQTRRKLAGSLGNRKRDNSSTEPARSRSPIPV